MIRGLRRLLKGNDRHTVVPPYFLLYSSLFKMRAHRGLYEGILMNSEAGRRHKCRPPSGPSLCRLPPQAVHSARAVARAHWLNPGRYDKQSSPPSLSVSFCDSLNHWDSTRNGIFALLSPPRRVTPFPRASASAAHTATTAPSGVPPAAPSTWLRVVLVRSVKRRVEGGGGGWERVEGAAPTRHVCTPRRVRPSEDDKRGAGTVRHLSAAAPTWNNSKISHDLLALRTNPGRPSVGMSLHRCSKLHPLPVVLEVRSGSTPRAQCRCPWPTLGNCPLPSREAPPASPLTPPVL